MTTISVRELKANASEVLRQVSRKGKQYIITRHRRPWAKMVPLSKEELSAESRKRKGLRGSFPKLPDLSESDFDEAKNIWPPT